MSGYCRTVPSADPNPTGKFLGGKRATVQEESSGWELIGSTYRKISIPILSVLRGQRKYRAGCSRLFWSCMHLGSPTRVLSCVVNSGGGQKLKFRGGPSGSRYRQRVRRRSLPPNRNGVLTYRARSLAGTCSRVQQLCKTFMVTTC